MSLARGLRGCIDVGAIVPSFRVACMHRVLYVSPSLARGLRGYLNVGVTIPSVMDVQMRRHLYV